MARPLRIQYPGAVYHVTARGNERKSIVRDDKDRFLFLRVLEETIDQYEVILHAWVLMDNHYHLLVETPDANLSLAIRHLNGVYTQRFNRRHHRWGHLFQGRYHAILVDKDSYLKELCRYVVLNPVRAKMVKQPKEWKWSSYRAMAGYETAPLWLTTSWLLGQFHRTRHKAQEQYRQFVLEGVKDKESPWENLSSQIVLGTKEFEKHVRHRLGGRHHREAPQKQQELGRPQAADVMKRVAKLFKVPEEGLLTVTRRPNEGREVAMWALRQACGIRLGEIAGKMGVGYSAVAHAVIRVRRRAKEDKGYAEKLQTTIFKT